jgi:uncharacterized protein YndB with AHSA1/START domain
VNTRKKERRDKEEEYGVVTGPGTVRIERLLPGPIERVWAYITDSEKRGKWLASGPMDLKPGGQLEFVFRNSELSPHAEPTPEKYKQYEGYKTLGLVTRCEPPRHLSFTWDHEEGNKSEVTFELTSRGKKVLLVLTHRRLATRSDMLSVSTGWHSHLDILIDILNDREPRPFWSKFNKLEPQYEKRIPIETETASTKTINKGPSR